MKSKLPVYFLPVLVLSFLFYSFTTSENSELKNVTSAKSINSLTSSSGFNVLILVHDSTVSTTKRTADRDTLRKYLPDVVGANTLMTFDTSTVLPDLTGYDFIIIQETSFDVSTERYLGKAARDQLRAWLATGNVLDRKRLLMIGGDLGWNYSRSGSNGQDLGFADTILNFNYRVDNGSSAPYEIIGINADNGNTRSMTSSVAGGGYWPDGCSMTAGGEALYRYQNHTDSDTLAAIGNMQAGYVTASMFQDPRYFTGDFGIVFEEIVLWMTDNVPLPVELASFVSTVSGNNVTLNWSTSSEINNSGFDIERSSGENEWSKIANIVGNGTTNENSSYTYTDNELSSGSYSYRLKQIDFNGNFEYFNLANEVNVGAPQDYKLSQNYPNPFNPTTKIEYSLPNDGFTVLTVFDNSGREVSRLVNEFKTSGYYTVSFDGSSLSSGSYFYRLEVKGNNEFTQVKKMILVK